MYIFSFEKLEVWKEAIRLSKDIYKTTSSFPSDEKFGLVSQIRRATNSVAANLAEGTSKITNKDKAYFTTIAFNTIKRTKIYFRRRIFKIEKQYL